MARKNVRSTSRQIEMLVDYMSTHTHFANGQWRSHDEEWVRAQKLLQEYGPSKTVEQWRTTWRDLKKKARADGARANAARVVTGNDTIIPTLSETSLKILNIIGTDSAYGMAGQRESLLGEILVAQSPPATSPAPATPPPPTTILPPHISPPDTSQLSTFSATQQNLKGFLADISNNSLLEKNALMERKNALTERKIALMESKLRRRHLEKYSFSDSSLF